MIFGERAKISKRALKILEDPSHTLHLSAASLWEIAIKYSLGKLSLEDHPERWLPDVVTQMGLKPLSIAQHHSLALAQLPWHHRDPFDRLLVVQAKSEGLTLVSPDRLLKRYKVPLLW